MNKHLLLSYSWTFGHVGDVGITAGLLELIHKQKPELPIRLLAWQGAENEEFLTFREEKVGFLIP